MGVVGKHEGFDLLGGDARIREVRSAQAFATQYRKPDFDKTQPGRVYWQEVEHECPLRMGVQPTRHFGRPVRADRVQDQMDRLAHGCLLVEQRQQFAELARTVLEADHAAYLAIVNSEASEQIHGAVALVFELASRWPSTCWRPKWYGRLVWRRRLADANTWLLVDTEQRPIGGRI